MASIQDVYGTGETLKAADLQGREPTVVIATVTAKQFNDGNKLILTFEGKQKYFVCNKTNASRIALLYGDNYEKWIGKAIKLYTDIVDFQGKATQAIRVRPPDVRGKHVVTEREGYSLSTARRPDPIEEIVGNAPPDEYVKF